MNPEFAEGVEARKRGEPRDVERSLDWLDGYDMEAAKEGRRNQNSSVYEEHKKQ